MNWMADLIIYTYTENFILGSLAGMFILWIFFVNVMVFRDKILEKYDSGLPGVVTKVVGVILVLVAGLWDILFNVVIVSLIMWQLPPTASDYDVTKGHKRKNFTLSERFKLILYYDDKHSKRYKVAKFACKYLIEPWDYKHCAFDKE